MIEGQSPGGEFGGALALSSDGKHLVVGSRAEDSERGAMRMYEITDSAVLLRRMFVGQGASVRAGWSVSVSTDVISFY